MDKKDILDRYFLEEVTTETKILTGWKILGEIPTNKYLDNKTIIHVKTRNEAWLDEFDIILQPQTGLVLVSPECPQRYIEDNLERDILGIMSQLYITESKSSLMSSIIPDLTSISSSPYKVWCGENNYSSGNSIDNSITTTSSSGGLYSSKLSNYASNNISVQ